MSIQNSLLGIATDLESLESQYAEKLWALYTTGFDFGVDQAQAKINELMKDKSHYKIICDAMNDPNATHFRGAQILYNSFKKYHYSEKTTALYEKIQNLETSIMDVINKNRSILNGQEVTSEQIGKILTESPDGALRKQAYESRIPLNKKVVDTGFIQLLDLRKEFAISCNAPDFITLKLEEDELTPALFNGWKEECSKRKEQLRNRRTFLAQKFLKQDDLKPWDYGFLKTAVCKYNNFKVDFSHYYEPISKLFSKYGFDITKLNLTYDIFPRKNKSEWGYNFIIARGKDSRILANVSNRLSNYWVLLHETAHGVHFSGLDPSQKLLNRGISGIVAEGFANFFGDLCYSEEFLTEVLPQDEVENAVSSFKALKNIQNLQSFDDLATALFDQELYKQDINSIDDIHNLKWSINRELLDEEPYSIEPVWANLIHHTSAPVDLHNYILGDVMCENMKNIFYRHTGVSPSKNSLGFGQFWKTKVLEPSGTYPFLNLYEKVCEEPLNIGSFLDHCLDS